MSAHAVTDLLRVARGARIVLAEQVVIACQRVRVRFRPSPHPRASDTVPRDDPHQPADSGTGNAGTPRTDTHHSPDVAVRNHRHENSASGNGASRVASTSVRMAEAAETAAVSTESIPSKETTIPLANAVTAPSTLSVSLPTASIPRDTMRIRRVPETPVSRFLSFASLGAGLAAGAAFETARRTLAPSTPSTSAPSENVYSSFITPSNAARLANTLSRMRGAALKLGQMLSIQDSSIIPPALLEALERVRQSADVMPSSQLTRVLNQELGDDWRERVIEFDDAPFAAASIGQVHRGVIAVKEGESERRVEAVFKVQYPGVARSIVSDLGNLKRLVSVGNFIPDSFFLDEAIKVAEEELTAECDYVAEANHQARYRELVRNTPSLDGFYVPEVFHDYSSGKVLVSERVAGVPIDKVREMDVDVRNSVAQRMMRLVMAELFVFGFQQSDPNWSNYLYDPQKDVINLIDFGAAKEYSAEFLMNYLSLIRACANRDRDNVIDRSIALGFLTGEETKEMFDAHVAASFAVGEPFNEVNRRGFDFATSDIPARTAKFGKVMLQYRLTPPPKEAYSLHRRLSGAFLMSTKLGAVVRAREALDESIETLKSQGKIAA